MKYVPLIICAALLGGFSLVPGKNQTLNKVETKSVNEIDIFEYLEETKEGLEESVKGLSDEQMQFKPAEDRWSIAQCVEHIILVEASLKNMLESKFKEPATPERRSEVTLSDEDVVDMITNRTSKVKTSDEFQPDSKFSTAEEALKAFEDQRENTVDFLKDLDVDMRNYVNDFPFGKLDGHQAVLFLAGHAARHTAQIEEVKQDPNFPTE